MRLCLPCFILLAATLSCSPPDKPTYIITGKGDTIIKTAQKTLPPPAADVTGRVSSINTGTTTPQQLLTYAATLTGTPYQYGSTDPTVGFDCSGFITYVFNHFKIAVPRSSVDFTYVQHEVAAVDAKPGDLILFTGTDSTIRTVGHMGIITSNTGGIVKFIHSTSGRANGVTETAVEPHYHGRYVKTIRIFPANDL